MDTEAVLHHIIKQSLDNKTLPPMTPDQIDDFITWLYIRVDLPSFERSDISYKLRMFRQFLKDNPPHHLIAGKTKAAQKKSIR